MNLLVPETNIASDRPGQAGLTEAHVPLRVPPRGELAADCPRA